MKQLSRSAKISAWVLQVLSAARWFRYVTGGIEVGSAVLLLIPGAALLGALLLACTMVGAILTHLLVLHSSPAMPIVLLVLVGEITWLRRSTIARFSVSPARGTD